MDQYMPGGVGCDEDAVDEGRREHDGFSTFSLRHMLIKHFVMQAEAWKFVKKWIYDFH